MTPGSGAPRSMNELAAGSLALADSVLEVGSHATPLKGRGGAGHAAFAMRLRLYAARRR